MPKNSTEVKLRGGNAIQRRGDGRISDVHNAARGIDIHNGLDGRRRLSVARPDGSRIVAERGRPGFIERPFARRYGGHDFARRTFYDHGHPYDRFYRGYSYHGVDVQVYAPVHYYGVGFYGWVYHPWYQPAVYSWGWAGSPWFGFYGGYFAPYAVYPSASLWLTDYMISSDLQAEYQANQEAGNVAVAADALGSMWDEREGETWVGIWTRRGTSNIFDASWGNGSVRAELAVSVRGPSVFVERRDSSDGVNCNYQGTIAPDGEHVAGTYGCTNGGRGVPWQATIEGIAPAAQAANGGTELTPDVKQAISTEVANQIALENYEAQQNAQGQDPALDPSMPGRDSSSIDRMLTDGHPHVFVAGSDLDVVDAAGNECAISPGDALELTTPPGPSDTAVNLVVLASKGRLECPKSDSVTIALNDLQEMQNHMRETIDQGLQQLQAKQGQGGLPHAPSTAQVPPVNAGFTAIAPPPEPPDSAQQVLQLPGQADAVQNEVTAQAQGQPQ
jgi:hypothetical protein